MDGADDADGGDDDDGGDDVDVEADIDASKIRSPRPTDAQQHTMHMTSSSPRRHTLHRLPLSLRFCIEVP